MRGKVLMLVALTVALAGCATPSLQGRDEWLAETRAEIRGRQPEQALRASEAVIRALSPGRTSVSHRPGAIEATRSFFGTIILVTRHGQDIYTVEAEPMAGGTLVTARVRQSIALGPLGPYEDKVVDTAATYRMFFQRLRVALGLGGDWPTCANAEAVLGLPNAGDIDNALCGIGTDGDARVAPRPEWTAAPPAQPASVMR
jgi:hypothetical protein